RRSLTGMISGTLLIDVLLMVRINVPHRSGGNHRRPQRRRPSLNAVHLAASSRALLTRSRRRTTLEFVVSPSPSALWASTSPTPWERWANGRPALRMVAPCVLPPHTSPTSVGEVEAHRAEGEGLATKSLPPK